MVAQQLCRWLQSSQLCSFDIAAYYHDIPLHIDAFDVAIVKQYAGSCPLASASGLCQLLLYSIREDRQGIASGCNHLVG